MRLNQTIKRTQRWALRRAVADLLATGAKPILQTDGKYALRVKGRWYVLPADLAPKGVSNDR